MPLSKDPKDTGKDIKELESTGHPKKQAIAIALKETGQSKYCYDLDEIINNRDKHKFSDETNKDIDGVLKKKYGLVSSAITAVDLGITGYKVAKKIAAIATMFDTHPHTLEAIERILLEKYGPALKFSKEEADTTPEFDEMSEEEIQALGEELIKQLVEGFEESEEAKTAEKEEPEKTKFANDKHDKATGQFAPKNGGEGSAKTETPKEKAKKRVDDEEALAEERKERESKKTPKTIDDLKDTVAEIEKKAKASKGWIKASSDYVGEKIGIMNKTYGKVGTAVIIGAGLAGTGLSLLGGAPGLAVGAILSTLGTAVSYGIADIKESRRISAEKNAVKEKQQKTAKELREKATEIAKKIIERKKAEEERQKIGELAEEIATRTGEEIESSESPVTKKVQSDVHKRLIEDLVKKAEEKETINKLLKDKTIVGKETVADRAVRALTEKDKAPDWVKDKRREVENENATATQKIEAHRQKLKEIAEKTAAREDVRDTKKDIRDQKSAERRKIAADEANQRRIEANKAKGKPEGARKPTTGKSIGGSGPTPPPNAGGSASTPAPTTPKTPSGGTTPENLAGIPGIGNAGTKTKKITDISAVTSKSVADYIKSQTSKKPANIYTGKAATSTAEAIDQIVTGANKPPQLKPDRGDVANAPPGSKLVGLFPESGTGEESYVRGKRPDYEGHGKGRPPLKKPPEKPGLPIMPTPTKPTNSGMPYKPSGETSLSDLTKPVSATSTPPYTPNPKLKPPVSKPKKKPKSIDQIIADANKKVEDDKSKHSMEEVLKRMNDTISKYACMPMGANTFVPSTKKKKAKFEESTEYETIENIPIFDAHNGNEEGLDIDFDEAMLQKIIDRCNERIEDTGDHPVIIDGHTEDGEDDPKRDVLGFASNFQMGMIGNKNPRQCIYCDFHIKKEYVERAKNLPRRSIELFHKDLVADPIVLDRAPIDNIALLGDVRPARDLGLLFSCEKISKKFSDSDKYSYSYKDESNMDNQLAKELLELVMQLPAMQWAEGMARKEAESANEAEQMAYDEEHAEGEMKAEGEVPGEEPAEDSKGSPEVAEEKKDEEAPGPAKLKMQYEQVVRKNNKLDAEYKALFSKVAELERQERVAQRKADFLQLEAEGYVFDMAEEVDIVKDMDVARFSKHLSNIRKNYKKAPVGFNFVKAVVPGEPVQLSPRETMVKAMQIADEKYGVK